MKALLFGKRADELKPLLEMLSFEITETNPQVIITYGGDGTLLASERKYPGVPKLAIRDNTICIKCASHKDESIFRKLKESSLPLSKFQKLAAQFDNKQLLAVNDFVIRNQLPTHAIRFQVFKNNREVSKNLIIGDGVVVSTVFGSTGYFKSITRQTFSHGFGLAFNNTTEELKPLLFSQNDTILVRIIRGPSTLSHDNSPDIYILEGNSQVIFKPSSKLIKLYQPETLRCPSCEIKREIDSP